MRFVQLRHPLAATLAAAFLAGSAAAQTVRVDLGPGGAEPNGPVGDGVLSGDGRFVAFASTASNLIAGDTNASADVFVRDLAGATTSRVSVASDGLERSGDSGYFPPPGSVTALDISDDGRFVVFVSRAPLVPGDTAICVPPGESAATNCPDVYLRDRQAGETVRISVGPGGADPDGASLHPQISGDGRWVVFASDASNLVAGDTNGVRDVFLLDRQSGATSRISVAVGGAQLDLPSTAPAISADGGVIAFVSQSALPSAEPNPVPCERAPPACERPFVLDRLAGTIRRVPMPAIVTRVTFGNPPLTVTHRVTVDSVGVAPDGSSVFATASVVGSFVSITQGFRFAGWVYDRASDRLVLDLGDTAIRDWDGRRYTSYAESRDSIRRVTATIADAVTGLVEPIETGDPAFAPLPGGFGGAGRSVVYAHFDVRNGGRRIFVRDLDGDADGMASFWETFWGLDPASPADAAADPDADGVTSLGEYTAGGHPLGSHRRYLAEGTSNAFFSTSISVANPGAAPVPILVRYQGDDGSTAPLPLRVHARGQRAFPASMRTAASFATVVESSAPIVVDRTMSWGDGYGSHAETAMAAPSMSWFLAEGATHGRFTLFYLLQNPGAVGATADVTYLRPAPAAPLTRQYTIAPASRLTIAVDGVAGLAATDVSAAIESDVPILVERAMYLDTLDPPQVFGAGHAGAGVTATSTRWFLAEGATGSFFDLYYLVANPTTQATVARISYLLPTGAPIVRDHPVPAQSRLTISVDFEDPRLADTPVSAIVESTNAVGLVVERSMWWRGQGQWQEGHLAAGSTVSAQRWALAAGMVGAGMETYVLIANPGTEAGTVTLTTMPSVEGLPPETSTFALPAQSRLSVPMSRIVTPPTFGGLMFGTLVESDGPAIVVERAIYTDFGGVVWAAGNAALGTPLP